MRKFILKACIFSLPVAGLFLFTLTFYATDKGDLIRVGYIIDNLKYRTIFKTELEQKMVFTKITAINQNKPQKFKVLTIGDSFSEQFGFGYKNYLVKNHSTSVLHLDKFLNKNPITSAYGILNGNVLDKIKVDYIILQSVEREFVARSKTINKDTIISFSSINQKFKEYNDNFKKSNIDKSTRFQKIKDYIKKNIFKSENSDVFSPSRAVKFPVQNLLYLWEDNAYDSDTYKVKTRTNLFSVASNDLLFLSSDLDGAKVNNDTKAVIYLNELLNDLSQKCQQKGIRLIVLPSPDKFDFYYDDIIKNKRYPKPMFFDHLEPLSKSYLYLNSKKVLQRELKNKKDIYFYDDTHWSPWASQVIACELSKMIQKKD